jgi:hypothetical protein
MNGESVDRWAEAYRIAWETADSEAAAALFSEEGTYRDNIFQEPHEGRTGVVEYWSGVTAAQSNVTVQMGEPFVDGERAVVEFWTTMDIDDSPVTLAGSLLLDFDQDGLCRSLREYWSFTDGHNDPPLGWGT